MNHKGFLDIFQQGVDAWNQWREDHFEEDLDFRQADFSYLDLSDADLSRADFSGANLKEVNFSEASLFMSNLSGANLCKATLFRTELDNSNLSRANLREANLVRARLWEADLSGADMRGVDMAWADFTRANLSGADLSGSFLDYVILIETNLEGANITDCDIYGISVWGANLNYAIQKNLIITDMCNDNEPIITVDNLEVAQFIYLLLNKESIRHAIDTITSKVVLILGRFSPERKAVLEGIREELRKCDYVPILFDFEKPDNRDFTETVSTLARMARFIIADITDPKSIPLELQAIIPDLAVPVQPVLAEGSSEFSMFRDLRRKYHWVLQVHIYKDLDDLLVSLSEMVIAPAEAKAKELKEACTGNQATT